MPKITCNISTLLITTSRRLNMNNVIISYKDKSSVRDERYSAGPYQKESVDQMANILRKMGCTDFKFIPTKKPPVGIPDRKSVVRGKSVSVRVDLGGRRIIKKKTTKYRTTVE